MIRLYKKYVLANSTCLCLTKPHEKGTPTNLRNLFNFKGDLIHNNFTQHLLSVCISRVLVERMHVELNEALERGSNSI